MNSRSETAAARSPRFARRLSRADDAGHGLRRPGPAPGRARIFPTAAFWEVDRLSVRARRLGRLRRVGPDPAVVHVHGRRGHGLFLRQPPGPRADRTARCSRTPWCARSCWCCWAFFSAPTAAPQTNFTFEDVLVADRPGLHVPVPAVGPATLAAVRRGDRRFWSAIGVCFTSIRLPRADFDYATVGVRRRLAALARHRRSLGQEHERRRRFRSAGS